MYRLDVKMLLLNAYNYGNKENEYLKYIFKRRDLTFERYMKNHNMKTNQMIISTLG